MKLKDYSKEDLETMSYSEITNVILAEKGSKMKIVDIFKNETNWHHIAERHPAPSGLPPAEGALCAVRIPGIPCVGCAPLPQACRGHQSGKVFP